MDAEKDSNKTASEDRDTTIRTALGIGADGTWTKGVINDTLNPADVATALSNVETTVTDGQSNLNARVNDLLNSINSKIYKYQSPSAALAHNFAHNLGSTDLNVQVWVQDPSGSWRNDIVPVTVVDDNNIGCLLTQAAQVKILCTAVTAATANASSAASSEDR